MGGILTPRVIERLRRSGLNAINLTAVRIGATLQECLDDLVAVREIIDRNSDCLSLVRGAADIPAARDAGRVGIIMGIQDTDPLGRDPHLVRVLKELGVRIVQMTHNRQSYAGTGCVEPDSGLTRFGRLMIEEMNRLGIAVDISHCGTRTSLDAIRHSVSPVLCTHSNPRAICASPRNKSDEIIRELAAKGGVIGMAAWSPLLYRGTGTRPKLSDLVDCIDHVVSLVGVDHVAIGTDLCDDLTPTPEAWGPAYGPQGGFPEVTGGLGDWYGFETNMAEGLDTISDWPAIPAILARRGYGAEASRQILGGNFLRAFGAACGH